MPDSQRFSSFDAQSINTVIHVPMYRKTPPTSQHQPEHQLKRKKGCIFGVEPLRTISVSSSSDPEDAPNRPHILPPLHDSSSDPERSSIPQQNDVERGQTAFGASSNVTGSAFSLNNALIDPGYGLTVHEKLSEVTELIQVRTVSAGVTLQRLAELSYELDGQQRHSLLAIARSAGNFASKEYARVRRTRQKYPLARMLERNAEVPLADVNDYKECLSCLQWQAKELQNGVEGLAGFREVFRGVEDLQKRLDGMSNVIERGDSAADMARIQWWVERKCMFWAAIDILTAGITQSSQAEDMDC